MTQTPSLSSQTRGPTSLEEWPDGQGWANVEQGMEIGRAVAMETTCSYLPQRVQLEYHYCNLLWSRAFGPLIGPLSSVESESKSGASIGDYIDMSSDVES